MGEALVVAHGWRLAFEGAFAELVQEYLRPAVQAVPTAMAARLKPCRITVAPRLDDPEAVSRWRRTSQATEIEIAVEELEPHDAALELLLCVGQVLWEELTGDEQAQWLDLLRREIEAGVSGEIDEQALEAKQRLLAGAEAARSRRRLIQYARASFAATAAEYLHCLWHEVTVRTGPEHLPGRWLRLRLELLARWFQPDPGYRLFAETP